MTGYNKVFLDTTPLIYFLDSDINFGEKTKMILEEVISEGKELVTSAVTCMEYMVYPCRTGNQDKQTSTILNMHPLITATNRACTMW